MTEILSTNSWRFAALHRRHKHSIIIYQAKRAIRTDYDIVWLDVAMGKRLWTEPSRHLAETVAEHRHSVSVRIVSCDVCFHRLALNPVHQQHRKLFVLTVAVNEKLLLQILHGSDIRRIDILQLLGYLTVSLRTSFLLLGEALQSIVLPRLLVLHLEHDGKRTTAPIRLTVFIQHGHQMAEFVKIVLSIANGGEIFWYKRVLHSSKISLC